jgi:hypothetical protein
MNFTFMRIQLNIPVAPAGRNMKNYAKINLWQQKHIPCAAQPVSCSTSNIEFAQCEKRVIKFLQHLSSQLMWNRQIIELIFISPSRARAAVDELDLRIFIFGNLIRAVD